MTEFRFLDQAGPSGLRRTSDGYLVGTVKCARVGVQPYTRGELKLDGDPKEIINVYRPEEAVFAADSLMTYGGKPVTVGHPKAPVGAENWKSLAVGSVGSRVVRDGDAVRVDFAIMDAPTIELVESGVRQISMGYRTPMELRDGIAPTGEAYQAVQTGPIVINHMAVVDLARGGPELRIEDGASWGALPVLSTKESTMSTKIVVLGDSAVTLPLADAAAVEAFKVKLTDQLTEEVKKREKAEEELGAEKAKNKQLEGDKMTNDKLSKLIADRVALETNAKRLDDAIVCDSVSDEDLRKAAVIAKLGDSAVEGASAAEISGMFRALVTAADAAQGDTMRDALTHQTRVTDSSAAWGDSVASMAGVKFKN